MPEDHTPQPTDVEQTWPGVAKRLKRPAKENQTAPSERPGAVVAPNPKPFWPQAAGSCAFRHNRFAAR